MTLQEILDSLGDIESKTTDLGESIDNIDIDNNLGDEFNNIFDNFSLIRTWLEDKIKLEAGESVITSFLSEIRLVFDKYSASVSVVGSGEDGYGENYGGQSESTGIKFEATLDGVAASKVFTKSIVSSSDLV